MKSIFTDEQVITTLEAAKSCIFLCHLSCKHLQSTWLQVQKLMGCVFILPFASPHTRYPMLHGLGLECSPIFLQSSWSRGPLGRMLLTPRSGRAFLQARCRKGETPPEVPHPLPAIQEGSWWHCVEEDHREVCRQEREGNEDAKSQQSAFFFFLVSKNKTKQHKCD